MSQQTKRVVYVVVDGMTTEAFEEATSSGRAPAFDFLKQSGHYVRDSVAVFPTITPAASASLVTGEVPARHGIPGMCWYDRAAQRFVNYGQSPRAAVVEGVKQIVEDVLHNLNEKHLSPEVSTVHEKLDVLGVTTASMNFMVFRGPYEHTLKPNLLERMLLRKAMPRTMSGPKEHYWADVVSGSADACSKLISARGIEKRIKATDGWAACVARDLIERNAADMILLYLHENDHQSHKTGPGSQVDNLAEADEHIRYVLEAFDSWEQALDQVGFVITADHAQSPISDAENHIIKLDDVLADFSRVSPKRGKEMFDGQDLAGAGNGRVAFIYLNEERRRTLSEPVSRTLLECRGVDQVMWHAGERYYVASDRGDLIFWPSTDGYLDERGNRWNYQGDLAAVSGVTEGDRIRTPEYPLAMWRIKSALDLDRIGDLVVTMKLTYEVTDLAGGDHRGGGDHASLHARDSVIPFLSTLDQPPLQPSTVDVVPHIVEHFKRQR
jgi:Type I phosphodiesterase / nucleotide pyrophosphatase